MNSDALPGEQRGDHCSGLFLPRHRWPWWIRQRLGRNGRRGIGGPDHEATGGHVDAYVYTDYGSIPLATVAGELSTYISQYGSLIDGFYLDGMSSAPRYSSTANTLNVFEGNSASFSGLSSTDHSSSQYAYTIYGATTTSAMTADINEAVGFNAGDVYVTYQSLPNPYGQLPSYWDQDVAAIAAANAPAPVPEPGKGAMVILKVVWHLWQ